MNKTNIRTTKYNTGLPTLRKGHVQLRLLQFATAIAWLLSLSARSVHAQVTAVRANDFLNSIGVCTHISQGADNPTNVATCLSYAGIRNIRDDGSTNAATLQNFLNVHSASGAKVVLLPINGNIAASLAQYETLSGSGALLAAEGPNEPNNWPVTYSGTTSNYNTSFLPVAWFQRDLYAAVKADPNLAGIPVFHSSEAGGSEPDNVGLQFLTIPTGSGIAMPDGTQYADYANPHNYVCGTHLTAPVNNNAWNAEDPTLSTSWDGLYAEYGHTWHMGFAGYTNTQLQTLPRVTTETGWPTQGTNALTEDQQGKLFLNLYLAAYKRGWSYTFIYMLHDSASQGYWGLVHTDYSSKLSATYLHNMTTILSDTNSVTPGSLNYSIPSEPSTVHDLLIEKSNGMFELAVWDEKTTGSDTVTVNLGSTYATVNTYDPTIGTTATQTFTNVSSVTLTLSDHPIIIEIPTTQVIVDNADSAHVILTGSWTASTTAPGYYGSNYIHDGNTGQGTKSVRFIPNLPVTGYYEAFAWWTSGSNRATNVPIDVITASGTVPVSVNQQFYNGQWVSLGSYQFNSGTNGSILISNTATNGYVIADAVRFLQVAPADVVVDNAATSGVTLTGSWTTSVFTPGYYGSNYINDGNTGQGTKSVRFTPNLPVAGNYQVYAWWTSGTNRASNVPVSIVTATGTSSVQVNQTTSGGQWVSLGTFTFNSGTGGSVVIGNTSANGFVIADAVRFLQQ